MLSGWNFCGTIVEQGAELLPTRSNLSVYFSGFAREAAFVKNEKMCITKKRKILVMHYNSKNCIFCIKTEISKYVNDKNDL
ncbi:hypothetical protein L596_025662 [Steinernema carpocapsae]|uniref:Uncharacterized protein n=1 Tax=Steinernema carpocapsae TaxID=34508 RepID=A0A4U5M8F5_STECR|nr:hypothetical protein L596_025662 [Steinernema carpocapsae]